ncbi:MAG: efflux RND transporter periplasmic adaptor subunit [Proteobacteria bacterium]|nr:efflux RND transporter periplasmic adaptor subunit [Pseudomonadota bacterium]
MIKILKLAVLIGILTGTSLQVFAGEGHDDHPDESASSVDTDHDEENKDDHSDSEDDGHGHGDESAGEGIELSAEQQSLADIKVETIRAKTLNYKVYAPGEIQANGYTSYLVSPRVDSVVLKRHKALGDHVQKGDALVTLFSESVAEAQANFRITGAEWKRVKQLGRKAIGDNRYVTAKNDYELANARLLAFGLSDDAIKTLAKRPLGEYTLIANTDGAILSDEFQQGQRVEAGHALMLLSDESMLWVEAHLQSSIQLSLPVGTQAEVKVGKDYYVAEVSQEAHTIDPNTRTRVIRLLLNNTDHRLHAGQFADVYFVFKTDYPVMAVPEAALMRGADGDWTVFVQDDDGEFQSKEIELGRTLGEFREISGVPQGSKIVTEGAFFVASQIAKGGFDPHNH